MYMFEKILCAFGLTKGRKTFRGKKQTRKRYPKRKIRGG